MVDDFEGSQGQCFDEQVFVNQVSACCYLLAVGLDLVGSWVGRLLKETREGFEKPHDLGFAEDVGEDLKISAEFGEAFKAEQFCLWV